MSILYIIVAYFITGALPHHDLKGNVKSKGAGLRSDIRDSTIFHRCKIILGSSRCKCTCNGIPVARDNEYDNMANYTTTSYPDIVRRYAPGLDDCLRELRAGGCLCGCMGESATTMNIIDAILPPGYFRLAYESCLKSSTATSGASGIHEGYKEVIKKGELVWLGIPLASFIFTKTFMISNGKLGSAEASRLLNIYHMRDKELRPEEDELFTKADELIKDADGNALLKAVNALKKSGSKGNWVTVFNTFAKPFRHGPSIVVRELIVDVNKALSNRGI